MSNIENWLRHTVESLSCCARYVASHVQVALWLSVSGPSMVSVAFRLVRSWLFCSGGIWLRLFVARFQLDEVGWSARCSSTRSVLLSVVSVWGILCGPLQHGRAGKLLRRGIRLTAGAASCAFEYKRPWRHARTSSVPEVGSPMAWVLQMQFPRHRNFLVFVKKNCARRFLMTIMVKQQFLRTCTTPRTDSLAHNPTRPNFSSVEPNWILHPETKVRDCIQECVPNVVARHVVVRRGQLLPLRLAYCSQRCKLK